MSSDANVHHDSSSEWIFTMIISICYLILTFIQLYAFIKQHKRNILVYLFTISLILYTLTLFLSTLDAILITFNSQKIQNLPLAINVLKISALALFILFVLIIAKGWPTTRPKVTAKPLVAIAWIAYLASEIILYNWTKGSMSEADYSYDRYLTVPGYISLGIRIIIMLWFLFELRATMMLEQDQQKLRFYLHFTIGIMVWFIYLPIVVIMRSQTSINSKYNFVYIFSLLVNLMAYSIMAHFLWPTKLTYHFLTQSTDSDYSENIGDDDLEQPRHPFNCLSHIAFANGAPNRYVHDICTPTSKTWILLAL